MIGENRKTFKKAGISALIFIAYVCFFVLFWVIAYQLIANDYLFPSFTKTMKEMGKLFYQKHFLNSFLATFLRCLQVFAYAFLFGCALAIISYLLPVFFKILAPIITLLRALPTMAIIVMILLWTTPKDAPVVVAFLGLFPMLYTGIYNSLSGIDKKLLEMCKIYKVPLFKRIFVMYFPLAMPSLLRECGAGLSFSLKLIVSAEVMANTFISLGGMISEAKVYLMIPKVFALTVLVVVVGIVMEMILLALASFMERRIR